MTNDQLINDEIKAKSEFPIGTLDNCDLFCHFLLLAGSRIDIYNGIVTGLVIRVL